jgi:hypothetical protein
VYLDVGQAGALRADARAGHLQCPLPTCPDRRLTTRGGAVRDHFAHMASPDGPHGNETVAHHTAKHLLGRRLREEYPDARVNVDDLAVDSGARPDVLIELPDGRRVAYEVQYAGLTPEDWQRRHERYAAENIRDVWLFGGPRYQRRPRSAYDEDSLAVGPTLATVLRSRHPLLLIDAADGRVALGEGPGVVLLLGGEATGGDFRPTWYPLAETRWPGAVLELPGMREQLRRGRQHRENRLRRLAELEDAQRAYTELQRHLREREETWQLERQQLEHERGALPSIIDVELPTPAHVTQWFGTRVNQHAPAVVFWPLDTQPPAAWRWRLLLALDRLLGTTVDYATLRRAVFAAEPASQDRPDLHDRLLDPFVVALRDAGYLWFAGRTRPVRTEGILVLGGAETSPVTPDRFGRRILLTALPVTLVENPSGTLLWQAKGPAGVTTVATPSGYRRWRDHRPDLLPGAIGQCGSGRRHLQ